LSVFTFLYNLIFIPFAKLFVLTAKYFNKKIKEREDNYLLSLDSLSKIDRRKPTILIHSSSMGEFEQAKPIIERIKREDDINIICSFYSPSGYINQQNYEFADAIVYLPFDSKKNARMFLQRVNPDLVIFIRYDIWHNHLLEISKRNCNLWLIDATEPQSKIIKSFLFWSFTKFNYNLFDKIYTLTERDYKFFNSLKLKTEIVKSTDTRFDRIIEKVENAKDKQIIPRGMFDNDCFILVAGSTWDSDEELIANTLKRISTVNRKICVVFVPHEPTPENIDKLTKKLDKFILYSSIKNANPNSIKINHNIIVDEIGILLNLYAIADAAFIGGGFGAGVHSVTEPAGYSIPVACGTKMTNSPDAINLKSKGALEVVHNEKEMFNWLRSILLYDEQRLRYGEIAGTYVYKSKGSSHIISRDILNYLNTKN
jgi:3-deoxy-D-manno-octulosonic-acid transferase